MQAQEKCEGTIHSEFTETIQMLQLREKDLLSTSKAISTIAEDRIATQLASVSAAREHIGNFKSMAVLNSRDASTVLELCDSIAGILQEFGSEHLSPCVREDSVQFSVEGVKEFKAKIAELGSISYTPVLEGFREEIRATAGKAMTLCGQWSPYAVEKDLQVRIGDAPCSDVSVVVPGSVLAFTVPENGVGCQLPVHLTVFGETAERINDTRFSYEGPVIQNVSNVPSNGGKLIIRGRGFGTSPNGINVVLNGVQCEDIYVTNPNEIKCIVPKCSEYKSLATLSLTVSGQSTSSTVYYGMWDPNCCGHLLVVQPEDPSTVYKPKTSSSQYAESTAISTMQLDCHRMYMWHLSISDLEDYGGYTGCMWVAYGLIDIEHTSNIPFESLYGWSTSANRLKLPIATPSFHASCRTEEVTLVYDVPTQTLTATWPQHNNATATVDNVPTGLSPAVIIWGHNTVKITWLTVSP
ncbi:hypothetical protein Pelo_1205 [Pelomyxa schiedti]|nr:hypothetical protein Pelo_1205 [Pelomyxa schiedti]